MAVVPEGVSVTPTDALAHAAGVFIAQAAGPAVAESVHQLRVETPILKSLGGKRLSSSVPSLMLVIFAIPPIGGARKGRRLVVSVQELRLPGDKGPTAEMILRSPAQEQVGAIDLR